MPSHFDLTFQDSYKIRIIIIDDQPWFVASDVCDALSIVNTARALSRLDEDEKDIHSMNTPGGEQKLSTINESGLYSLILTSRKAEARKFKRWVTSEVLPTIRKTGKYEHPTHKPEARELLTDHDTSNLARLVWSMVNGFRFEKKWTQGIWYALRHATGVASPQHFEVNQIPILAEECSRIYSFTNALKAAIFEAEKQAVRRVLRQREDADAVLSEMKQLLEESNKESSLLLTSTLTLWQQDGIQKFLQRH